MGELGLIALHTAIIYLFLVLAIRLVGRRALGQMSALDLLVLILLGSSVETSMVHGSTALRAGFVSATVLFALNRALTAVMLRLPRWRHLVGAGPTLLVHNGVPVQEHLKRLGISHSDLMQALRNRECNDLAQVRMAVMEPDGSINVIFRETEPPAVASPAPS